MIKIQSFLFALKMLSFFGVLFYTCFQMYGVWCRVKNMKKNYSKCEKKIFEVVIIT